MKLTEDEEKFLRDLINYTKKTSDNWKKSLIELSISTYGGFRGVYPEYFGPYEQEENKIIKALINKEILKIKTKAKETHRFKEDRKERIIESDKSIGIPEAEFDQLIDRLDLDKTP